MVAKVMIIKAQDTRDKAQVLLLSAGARKHQFKCGFMVLNCDLIYLL
jgi:hypothetical protein